MTSKSRRVIRTGLPIGQSKPTMGMHNRRGEPRFRYATSVFLLNRANHYPATTIDVSSTGARIRLESPVILDADCLFAAPSFGTLIPSVVVWRHGLELGVRFMAGEGVMGHEAEAPGGFGRRRARPDPGGEPSAS